MARPHFAIISALIAAFLVSTMAYSQGGVVVTVPARAGAVDGTMENSDAFIWRLFTEFVAPVSKDSQSPAVFETWATDKDTFTSKPHWPEEAEPIDLQASVLQRLANPDVLLQHMHATVKIDEDCKPPVGAAVGGFPASGAPAPCIAEQVARNRPLFNYIVNNNLNTQAGLAAAYAKSFKVDMPRESIALKADWIPLLTMLKWIPQLGNISTIKKFYYTVTVNNLEYALVAMHVSSRQNPNWVWGTFEDQMNPGRCDYIGCLDSFGAKIPSIPPNRTTANTQYGPCVKTEQLRSLMAKAKLSPTWENYCLKSTQVDYTAADGMPFVLGNSVIEGIVGNGTVAASSCMSCHYYASFGPTGQPTASAKAMLPFNPTGKPIPAIIADSVQFHFMWGVLLAPKP